MNTRKAGTRLLIAALALAGAGCNIEDKIRSRIGNPSDPVPQTLNGTWALRTGELQAYITFFSDGHYLLGQHQSGTADPSCATAEVELGSYTWDDSDAFTAVAVLRNSNDSTKESCGLADSSVTAATLTANDDGSLTYSDGLPGDAPLTLTRADDGVASGVPSIGSFHINDNAFCAPGSGGTPPACQPSGTTVGAADIQPSATPPSANLAVFTFIDASHYFYVNVDSNSGGGTLNDGCYSSSAGVTTFSTDPATCTVGVGGGLSAIDLNGMNSTDGLAVTASFNSDSSVLTYTIQNPGAGGYTDREARIPFLIQALD